LKTKPFNRALLTAIDNIVRFVSLLLVTLTILLWVSISQVSGNTRNADAIPILLYHNLINGSGVVNSANIDVNTFKKQMQYLHNNGYTTITPEQLKMWINGSLQLPPKSVMITFDDGYESVYTLAYPILKQYGFKATVFVITRSIADYGNHVNFPHMSWAQMQKASDVFTYGSHTDSLHYVKHGTSYLFYVDTANIIADLIKSRKILNNTLYFAYPYGGYDSRIISAVKKAGYSMAWTTQERYVYIGNSLHAIPRFTIDADMDRFIEVVTGKAHPKIPPVFIEPPKRVIYH